MNINICRTDLRYIRLSVCLFVCLSAPLGCKDTLIESPVPAVDMFEFVVNLSTPSYAPLRNSMSSVSVYNYGYQKHGILIYRHLDQSEMYAYDATCVDNAECLEKGIVSGDKDNSALGKCARCGAHYTLTDGIHTEKRIRLRAYSITPLPNATEQWRVSNR